MSHYHFTVILEPNREVPDRYNVRVPALCNCLTYGDSIEDALANARETVALYVEGLVEDGEPVPIVEHPVIATSIAITTSELCGATSELMEPAGTPRL